MPPFWLTIPCAIKRQTGTTRNGITITNVFDPVGRILATVRVGTDNTAVTNNLSLYDTAGRLIRTTNALGGVTTHEESLDQNGQLVRTTTYPDGGTRIEIYYQDGSLQKVLGSAAFPVRYEYGVEQDGGVHRAYTKEIKLDANGNDTSEWTQTYTDMLGRAYKTVYAAASGAPFTISYYNTKGQLTNQVDPDGVSTLYAYNPRGELAFTVIDSNRNYTIDFDGPDRITYVTNDVVSSHGVNVRRTRTYVWNSGSSEPTLLSTVETSVDGLQSWNTLWNDGEPVTTHTQTSFGGNGRRTVTVTAPDGTRTISVYLNGRLQSVKREDAAYNQLSYVEYGYDPHGRQNTVTDARNGTTTFWFNNADQINSTRTPDPGTGHQITTNLFDLMGRVWKTTLPDNTSVTNEYYPTGLLKKTTGSRTYPVEYTYDAQGRMKTMKTWTNYPSGNPATTTWNYNPYRGWLANKRYPDNQGPAYTYTAAGRLASRAWARGVTTTYAYNWAGDLSGVDYSDATPDVSYDYDRRGRQIAIAQSGGGTVHRVYNDAGLLVEERFSGGPLDGLSLTNGYDELLRRTNVVLLNPQGAILARTTYAYDAAGRLASVSDGPHSATYQYVENSPLVAQITFATDGQTVMTTSKEYDALNRLTAIASHPGGTPSAASVSFAYTYNAANQRIRRTESDASYWLYTYDALGQVISGKKYWSDGTPVVGQQCEYAFDHIGNRRTNGFGGNSSGTGLRPVSYAVNDLNQYTSRTVARYVNVLGEATDTASVSVNTNLAYRKDRYFRAELSVDNTAGPVWLGITNVPVLSVGGGNYVVSNVTGHVLWPKTPETFTYDADGNLTSDSLWTNQWNAENRRTVIESRAGVPVAARRREQWTHLPDGRWIERIVSTNNGTAYYPAFTNRYVWDGQVLLAVLDHANNVVLSFLRGLDLSGAQAGPANLQGAGGVGGLLAIHDASTLNNQPSTHFVCYDGNGNVAALVNAADRTETARYEYGPFGEPLRLTGPMAKANPIRFSTQYADDVTGDVKYLFRDYNASIGHWLNKDPLEEKSQLNLYGLVRNNPCLFVDGDGRQLMPPLCNACGQVALPGHTCSSPPPRNPPNTNAVSLGECRIQICCFSVAETVWEHCYLRFDDNAKVSGCRAGPSRQVFGSTSSSGSRGGVPAHCNKCCGFWGTIFGACGGPGSPEMAADFRRANQNCSTLGESSEMCAVRDCMRRKIYEMNLLCIRYHPFRRNSNSAIYAALRACSHEAPRVPHGSNAPGWRNIGDGDPQCK